MKNEDRLAHSCPPATRAGHVHSGDETCLACDLDALESLALSNPQHNNSTRIQTGECVKRIAAALKSRVVAHIIMNDAPTPEEIQQRLANYEARTNYCWIGGAGYPGPEFAAPTPVRDMREKPCPTPWCLFEAGHRGACQGPAPGTNT